MGKDEDLTRLIENDAIVKRLKNRIKTFTDYKSKLTKEENMILFELTEILGVKPQV